MKIFKKAEEIVDYLYPLKQEGKKIGLVPTMGALHSGHLSLIGRAKKDCDKVVCSIFINPTQFDNPEDLKHYPITLKEDLALLQNILCDYVFTPSVSEIYPNGLHSKVYNFGGIENEMEGRFRPGHFNGVATVIEQLFQIIRPDVAFFGEKDFQQLQIIKKLTRIKKKSTQIIGGPTFREKDGIAMSSRNRRLSKEWRMEATIIYKTLKKVKKNIQYDSIQKINQYVAGLFDKSPLRLDYFFIADIETLIPVQTMKPDKKYRAFIAAFAGNIRLIDNIAL